MSINERIEVLENAIDNLKYKDHWDNRDRKQKAEWEVELYQLRKQLAK